MASLTLAARTQTTCPAVVDREKIVFSRLGRETAAMIATYSTAEQATIRDFLRRSRDITAPHVDWLLSERHDAKITAPIARGPGATRPQRGI
jgi:hypothetical protein